MVVSFKESFKLLASGRTNLFLIFIPLSFGITFNFYYTDKEVPTSLTLKLWLDWYEQAVRNISGLFQFYIANFFQKDFEPF